MKKAWGQIPKGFRIGLEALLHYQILEQEVRGKKQKAFCREAMAHAQKLIELGLESQRRKNHGRKKGKQLRPEKRTQGGRKKTAGGAREA